MTLQDFKGSILKQVWIDDDNSSVLIFETPTHGLQGLRAEELTQIVEEDDE